MEPMRRRRETGAVGSAYDAAAPTLQQEEKPVELRTYIEILWRRKWVIATTAVTTLVVVVVGTLLATPVYEASTTLRAATALAGSFSYTDYTYSERLMNTYAEIAVSRPILGELGQRLGLDELPKIEAV